MNKLLRISQAATRLFDRPKRRPARSGALKLRDRSDVHLYRIVRAVIERIGRVSVTGERRPPRCLAKVALSDRERSCQCQWLYERVIDSRRVNYLFVFILLNRDDLY